MFFHSHHLNLIRLTLFAVAIITSLSSIATPHKIAKPSLWQSPAKDTYVSIDEDNVTFYEVTYGDKTVMSQPTCLEVKNLGDNKQLELSIPNSIDDFNIVDNEHISYAAPGDLQPHVLTLISELPVSCKTPLTINKKYMHQPLLDFDIFWNNINEMYAFFALRGISQQQWRKYYQEYSVRAQLTKNSTQLFSLFSRLMALVFGDTNISGQLIKGDGHVGLVDPRNDESWEFERNNSKNYSRSRAVRSNPLETKKNVLFDQKTFKPLINRGKIWGVLSLFTKIKNQNTGYLLLNSMIDYHNGHGSITIDDFSIQKSATEQFMNSAISLANKHKLDTIIVDVRHNMGGYDQIALQIASYFSIDSRLVLEKKARIGGTIDEPQWSSSYFHTVVPHENGFKGQVILLTSDYTVSAGESFTLAMSSFPNVIIMGQSSNGSLSDVLQKHTTNGWTLSLSNEQYSAIHYDGNQPNKILEGTGIAPDITIAQSNTSVIDAISDTDKLLQRAMKYAVVLKDRKLAQ